MILFLPECRVVGWWQKSVPIKGNSAGEPSNWESRAEITGNLQGQILKWRFSNLLKSFHFQDHLLILTHSNSFNPPLIHNAVEHNHLLFRASLQLKQVQQTSAPGRQQRLDNFMASSKKSASLRSSSTIHIRIVTLRLQSLVYLQWLHIACPES